MTVVKFQGETCDPDALAELAELYTSVEDAAVLLAVNPEFLSVQIDDPSSCLGAVWRAGRARARLNIRKAQFSLMTTSASLAVHLGRELLGQDGGEPGGSVTYIVNTGIDGDGNKTNPDGV